MVDRRFRALWPLPLALALMSCSGSAPPPETAAAPARAGGTIPPANSAEKEILLRIDQMPARAAVRVQGLTVIADYPYVAASGRTCRRITQTSSSGASAERLACSDGRTWFYVPTVFVTQKDPPP
jgi:hypothetical protein